MRDNLVHGSASRGTGEVDSPTYEVHETIIQIIHLNGFGMETQGHSRNQ